MRAVLRWLFRPVLKLYLRLHRPVDDWAEVPVSMPYWRFGTGSRRRFSWYFEGESSVAVDSIKEVVDWLGGCEYVSDIELFQEDDFWQHPRTFERLRQGDCDDFALWGWRKLNELGVPARLFVGEIIRDGEDSASDHAWVVFEDASETFLLEGARADTATSVKPLADVRDQYRPYFSVDASYRTTSYEGWLNSQKEKAERSKRLGSPNIAGT